MRYDAIQSSFLTGEISPKLLGNVELAGYKTGAKTVENMIIQPHGGMNRRGGFKFVKEVKDSSKDTILVELAYKDEFFFILEFGENYIRFYRAQAAVDTSSEVTTTYTEAELRDLRFTQDEDSLLIFHKNHLPARLSRVSHTEWHLIEFADDGVFEVDTIADQSDHTDDTYTGVALTGGGGSGVEATIVVSGNSVTRVTISDPGTGYAENDTLTIPFATIGGTGPVTCDVYRLTGENLPSDWGTGNYPTFGFFFEQRLWTCATPDQPNAIWSSKSASYFDFDIGTGQDDESIQIVVKDATKFMWATSGDKIMLGSHNGEFLLAPSSEGDALTPSNIRPVPTTNYGSSFSVPVQVDTNTIFLQRGLRKFRRTEYKLTSDTYSAKDITILSDHITKSGVIDVAFANEPHSYIWGVRNDGELVGLTYEPEYEVYAWHRHVVGGTDAEIKSIAVSDGATDVDRDELWAVIERTVDGSTVKYIEFMTEGLSPEDDQEEAFFVDSGVTKTGAFTVFDGLDHLEGETVSLLIDGAVQAPKEVASGEVTLDTACVTKGHAGLSAPAFVDPITPAGGNPIGTSEGKIKRVSKLALRLYRSLGFQVGEIGGTFDTYSFGPPDTMDDPIPLFTGDTDPVPYPGGHDRNIDIRVKQTDPLPLNILAIMYEASTK
ncbi:MAG: hypothetical protein GY820_17030 [Gammaproteobacteria bacterium]|nr:hypothetical protein [Gammaproteobacteria bacterium]